MAISSPNQKFPGSMLLQQDGNEPRALFKVLPAVRHSVSPQACGSSLDRDAKSNASLLFVEDEEAIRELSKSYLEGNGYCVFDAKDGEDAIALWQKHKTEIELVLTDVTMSGAVNGVQLAQLLQKDRPDLKVIFMSGSDLDSIAEARLPHGNTHFLPKPYTLKSLAAMVHDTIADRERRALASS